MVCFFREATLGAIFVHTYFLSQYFKFFYVIIMPSYPFILLFPNILRFLCNHHAFGLFVLLLSLTNGLHLGQKKLIQVILREATLGAIVVPN